MERIAIEAKNLAERTKRVTAERNKPIRKMEALVLKHRNGKIGSKTFFDYIPKYNLYKEGLPDKNSLTSLQVTLNELNEEVEKMEEKSQKVVRTIK